jgi:hypothetical protein
MRAYVAEPPHVAFAPDAAPLGVPCLLRAALLTCDGRRSNLARTHDERNGGKDVHAAPERMHRVERLALAVLHRARGDVFDGRLVGTDEYDVRHEHCGREYRE